jgi:hypothetical protein
MTLHISQLSDNPRVHAEGRNRMAWSGVCDGNENFQRIVLRSPPDHPRPRPDGDAGRRRGRTGCRENTPLPQKCTGEYSKRRFT